MPFTVFLFGYWDFSLGILPTQDLGGLSIPDGHADTTTLSSIMVEIQERAEQGLIHGLIESREDYTRLNMKTLRAHIKMGNNTAREDMIRYRMMILTTWGILIHPGFPFNTPPYQLYRYCVNVSSTSRSPLVYYGVLPSPMR